MASDKPTKKLRILREVLGDEVVTLYVGPTRKKFTVHKNLICDSSDFFKKGFTGNFLEGQEGIMNLPEDTPGVISIFIHWLYTSVVPISNTESHLYDLYDLYNFAGKLCLTKLKDTTIDSIQDMAFKYNLMEKLVAPALVAKGLESCPKDKGLRLFCSRVLGHYYVQRAIDDPPDDPVEEGDDSEDEEEEEDEEEDVKRIYLKQAHVDAIAGICKTDTIFLREVLEAIGYNMQIGGSYAEEASDPLERVEGIRKDLCFFHCHKKSDHCRARPREELPFIPLRMKDNEEGA